jgi:hypothetical protein
MSVEASPDEEEVELVDVIHGPPRLSQGIALAAMLVGIVLTAPFTALSVLFGISGAVIVAAGILYSHSTGWLTLGTGIALLGAVTAGAYGAVPVEFMLIGVTTLIVAWDVGQHGISLGRQIGRQADTRRAELVHAASTVLVIGVFSALAYLVHLSGLRDRPAPAVAVVIIGIVFMMWLFRR